MIAISSIRKSLDGKISGKEKIQHLVLLLRRFYIYQERGLIKDLTVSVGSRKPRSISTERMIEVIGIHLNTLLIIREDETDCIDVSISFVDNTSFYPIDHDFYELDI